MRTAEERIKFAKSQPDEMQTKWATETIPYGDLILAINEARKEAIEECAKRARLKYDLNAVDGITISNQSILSLIKELK